jgi:hypothetical protein
MKFDQRINRIMGMDDDKWRRHANPWSVWTRLATVPAFALAVYARVWLGWWCLLPVGAIIVFLWLNTRIFAPAQINERWETRAILGERLWLDRRARPIPEHHRRATRWIVAGSSLGVIPMGVGLIWLDPWATAFGAAGVFFGQVWFLDRLAWLYDTAEVSGCPIGGSDTR